MSKRWRDRQVNEYVMSRTMNDVPEDSTDDSSNLLYVGDQLFGLVEGYDLPNEVTYTPYVDTPFNDLDYTTPTGGVGTMGPNINTPYADKNYPGPGTVETFIPEWQDAPEYDTNYYPQLYIKDLVDYQVGGQFSLVNNFPYSLGVVSSDLVENFALSGEQVLLRRETDLRQMYGPVGTADPNAILALGYMQLTNDYYPNETSQADLVVSV